MNGLTGLVLLDQTLHRLRKWNVLLDFLPLPLLPLPLPLGLFIARPDCSRLLNRVAWAPARLLKLNFLLDFLSLPSPPILSCDEIAL